MSGRVEIITGPERRRRWSEEEKLQLVEEACSAPPPSAVPSSSINSSCSWPRSRRVWLGFDSGRDQGRDAEGKQRLKPGRGSLPAHLPRERVVHSALSSCPGCGGALRKLGEDITETLELVPAQWKVIQHVREKFSCRRCEAIT